MPTPQLLLRLTEAMLMGGLRQHVPFHGAAWDEVANWSNS